MKRPCAFTLVAFAASFASAFHVQLGFSGKSMRYARELDSGGLVYPATDSPFRGWTNEIGAAAEYLSDNEWGGYNYIACAERYETSDGSKGPEGVWIVWEDVNNPDRVALRTGSSTSATGTSVAIGETVSVGTFGYSYLPYVDNRIMYGVLTCRGDPYSTVMNDTAREITVNDVAIGRGQSAALIFPVHLKMPEIEGVKFYDLESGDELTPHDYASYGENGVYYHGGAYTLGYTGNIRISDGTSTPNDASAEPLVFGGMVAANEGRLLFAANGMPLRSTTVNISTNIALMTWWDFTQGDWGSPKAMINGEVVCDGHATSHIVAYTVNENNLKINEMNGKGYVYFTMSQTPQSGHSGGNCAMRCWGAEYGGDTSGYDSAPAEHKAEVSAGLGVARFRVRVNVKTGEWTLAALGAE